MDAIRGVPAVELTTVAAGQDAGLDGMAGNCHAAEAAIAADDYDALVTRVAFDRGVVPTVTEGRGPASPGEAPERPGNTQNHQDDFGGPKQEQGYVGKPVDDCGCSETGWGLPGVPIACSDLFS